MKQKTKLIETNELTDRILAPLIKHCQERGQTARVLVLFNEGMKKKVNQSDLYRWLRVDRSKAVQPNAGVFLRLVEVWQVIRGRDVVNRPEPTIYCVVNGHVPSHDGRFCKECDCAL